jgi:hypothetical protein
MSLNGIRTYPLVYLATPYSKYPEGIEVAFQDASRLAARLMEIGVKVYSPIAHTHPLAIYGGINPLDHSIWLPFDEAIMAKSDALLVAKMPTWQTSYGIAHEISVFDKAGKPIYYLNPQTMVLE